MPHRLSESPIWAAQQRFFKERGQDAWGGSRHVPEFITTNPMVGRAYARVATAWMRAFDLDPTRPLVVIELGAGTGRLAYHVLRHLLPLWRRACPAGPEPLYVMTDIAPANRQAWRAHPALRPFFDSGHLDTAHFDVTAPHPELRLEHRPGQLDLRVGNPPLLIANYVFDSVPQDLYLVRQGALYESQVELEGDLGADAEAARLTYHHRPVELEGLYPDRPDAWRATLRGYLDLARPSAVSLPTPALSTIDALLRDRGGALLCLDHGVGSLQRLDGAEEPRLQVYASAASFSVNLHALLRYAALTGGAAWSTGEEQIVVGCCWGAPSGHHASMADSFQEQLGAFNPEALMLVRGALHRLNLARVPDRGLLFHLQRAAWDPTLLDILQPALEGRALSPDLLPRWREALRELDAACFHGAEGESSRSLLRALLAATPET